MLTVFMHAYITGFMGDTIEMNANFANGHVKIMTRAYAENMDQMPNDLALLETSQLLEELQTQFGSVDWTPRIRFGGLLDVPDEQGETRSQGPVFGLGLDFLSADSREAERLNIDHALVRGQKISQPGEALISDLFAQKMHLNIGDTVTLIGSTMNGSMAFYNFTVAGTLSFGSEALDRGALLVDLEDARFALDMQDAAGEIIGFQQEGFYNDADALAMSEHFNQKHAGTDDAFAPVMKSLSQQGSMGLYVSMAAYWSVYISLIFVLSMALVLWNAGLLGSLRRYGEFGVRLAMGEAKDHVYITLIYEAIAIGISGTIIGTAFGLLFAWLLQTYGINISGMMEGASLMMPSTIRARITAESYYLGFIPGLLSTVAGTMLAGIGIYRRQTSQLFKELET
jgi:putative ABC transport system permease protein